MIQFGKYFKGDKKLWIAVLFLLIGSIPLTYSASGQVVFNTLRGDYTSPLIKRLVFTGMAIFVIMFVQRISFRHLNKFALSSYIIMVVLLLATALIGDTDNEARRSLSFSFLPFSFQTAAFAKIALIIYVSSLLSNDYNDKKKREAGADKAIMASAIMVIFTLPSGLSTTVIMLATVLLMLVIVRVNGKYLLKRGGQLLGGMILYSAIAQLFKLPFRISTWANRLSSWWQGFSCDQVGGGNYQACLSKSAIADGGLFGRGIGQSPLRYSLPEAHSDFIYAYIINEVGIFVGILILILYLVILYRGIQIAKSQKSTFPMFLALGLTLALTMQAFINIGVSIGIFPVTGQPLPFISRGGSSMMASAIAFGILLNISASTQTKMTKKT